MNKKERIRILVKQELFLKEKLASLKQLDLSGELPLALTGTNTSDELICVVFSIEASRDLVASLTTAYEHDLTKTNLQMDAILGEVI